MQDGCDEEKEGAPNGIFVCHVGRIDWGAFASNFVLAPTSKKDKWSGRVGRWQLWKISESGHKQNLK